MNDGKKISNEEIAFMRNFYEQSYENWLDESGMTEEELFSYRTASKFKIEKFKSGNTFIIQMSCENKENGKRTAIGLPFVVSCENNDELLYYAVFLMLYISKKLDDMNKIAPVNGSPTSDYFNRRVRQFAKNENLK